MRHPSSIDVSAVIQNGRADLEAGLALRCCERFLKLHCAWL